MEKTINGKIYQIEPGAYLSGADLSGADLSGADLSGAYLSGADLSGADLSGADLRSTDLTLQDGSAAKIKRLVAQMWRQADPYEFFGFATDKGLVIRAGCRTFTHKEYVAHVKASYAKTTKGKETIALLAYMKARL